MKNWTDFEKINRALQAHHGLVAFLTPPSERKALLKSFTKDTYKSIEMVQGDISQMETADVTRYCEERIQDIKSHFTQVLNSSKKLFFQNNMDKIWNLFINRYNLRTMQLRANIQDIHECFNVEILTKILKLPPYYFYRLPVSSELAIALAPEGIYLHREIVPRLLFLDMLLMYQHAQKSYSVLKEWAENPNDAEPFPHRARLDAYVRQLVITGVSTCECVLSDYGFVVSAKGKQRGAKENLQNFTRWGLTKKLDTFLTIWPEILSLPKPQRTLIVDDMIKIVQVRNRLVHYDGRLSSWHALQIDFHWLSDQGFSERIKSYLKVEDYGLSNSFIGYEIAFARFCIDTVLRTIDLIHHTVYPIDMGAYWIDIPRSSSGCVDFTRVTAVERMLQV